MVEVKFCIVCGRIAPCRKHFGKELKPKLKKQPRFSGDSRARESWGQFQSKIGR